VEKLVVDAEGKLIIPSHMLAKRGWRHGDELLLIEVAEGWLIYHGGVDSATARWWNNLSEQDRQQALSEARRYANLSIQERNAFWGDEVESE